MFDENANARYYTDGTPGGVYMVEKDEPKGEDEDRGIEGYYPAGYFDDDEDDEYEAA